MLGSHVDCVPTAVGRSHEVTWDGVRAPLEPGSGTIRLTGRNENVITAARPEIPRDPGELLLDAQIVAVNLRMK
jgi:ATP-dependent DNA ligase